MTNGVGAAAPPDANGPAVVIVYVPALAEPVGSADSFAERVAKAMDEEAPYVRATYSVQPPATTDADSTASSPLRRIIEHRDGTTRIVADIYRFEYETDLRRGFETASPLKRSVLLLGLLFRTGLFQLLPAVRKKGKRPMAKMQLGFALLVALVLSLYTLTIFGAALETVRQRISNHTHLGPLQGVALGLAGISAFVPAAIRKALENTAIDFYSASNYLGSGATRSNLSSNLSSSLEAIVEKTPPEVPIFVVSYSFGSIVALDAIFPPGATQPRRFKRITGLVTIGSPVDLVRSIWPTYFTNRAGEKPPLWYNIFYRMDVLGSNYLDADDTAEKAVSVGEKPVSAVAPRAGYVPPGLGLAAGTTIPENYHWDPGTPNEQLTFLRIFSFTGIRAHGLYWDPADTNDIGCIRAVVVRFADDYPAMLAQV